MKEILSEKNGITLQELALDVANMHGLTRTSKKQLGYIIQLIKPWAGFSDAGVNKPVVWLSADDVSDETPWRGLAPWGDNREWSEIPYPAIRTLAKLALEKSPNDPVDFICNVFELKRRYDKTLTVFKGWVDDVSE